MASKIPFVVAIKETVANGGTIVHQYKAPNNQDFTIHQILFVIGAAFSLIRVSDDGSNQYGVISTADPIPSTELPQSNTDVRAVDFPKVPLLLKGGQTLYIELLDTGGGGANTVILNGELSIP